MVPEVSGPDARRRSDDAVRRIREESARRIDGQRRRRAFSSWCALATLAGGISLAALDAHEVRVREQATRAVPASEVKVSNECAELQRTLHASDQQLRADLCRAAGLEREITVARAQWLARWQAVLETAAEKGGCPDLMPAGAECAIE